MHMHMHRCVWTWGATKVHGYEAKDIKHLIVLRSFVSTTVVFVPFAEVPSSSCTLGFTEKGNTPGI